MRSRHMRFAAALVAAASLVSAQMVYAHGGGGGGHGGGGGGHGGGFGGGHGGFGGGGFHGGGFGGYHGGGGFYGGGMGGRSFAAPSMHSAPSMGHINGSAGMSGIGARGLSGVGTHGLNGATGAARIGANSHLNQSILSNSGHAHGLTGATHNVQAGHLTGLTGRNAVSGLGQGQHQSQFLANHGVHNAAFHGNNLHNVNASNLHHNGNFNHFNHHRNNFFFAPFFFGGFWPWWGYGYGNWYPYRRFWGYPFGYGFGYPFLGLWGLYGGYGYGGYGGGYGYGYPYYGYNPYCMYGYDAYGTDELAGANQAAVNQQAAGQVGEFAAVGETDFKAGNYEAAVRDWRHAILDDPNNGVLVMMLAQALFADAKFDEAAGALQQGMLMLPDEQWGVVVSNYTELYPKIGDYTTQLRALEKAVKEQPDSPALRFLVGYHYGYLGYPLDATKQLAKAKTLAPQDELAKRLYDVFEAKANKGEGKPADKKADADLPPQAKADLPKF